MTAEIAVMNKMSVALAADSAVTIGNNGNTTQVYNGVNKLFALSDKHPVGVMIYDAATIMGVPWESAIKEFRKEISGQQYSKLEEYATHFLKFLKNSNLLFKAEDRRNELQRRAYVFFNIIREEIDQKVANVIELRGGIEEKEINEIFLKVVKFHFGEITKYSDSDSCTENFDRIFGKNYNGAIDKIIDAVFEKHKVGVSIKRTLRGIITNIYKKCFYYFGKTGLVFAGFGEKEIFPSLLAFEVDCVAKNYIKYKKIKGLNVNVDNPGVIIPFAQGDMVKSFMEGVHSDYEQFINKKS